MIINEVLTLMATFIHKISYTYSSHEYWTQINRLINSITKTFTESTQAHGLPASSQMIMNLTTHLWEEIWYSAYQNYKQIFIILSRWIVSSQQNLKSWCTAKKPNFGWKVCKHGNVFSKKERITKAPSCTSLGKQLDENYNASWAPLSVPT